MSRLIASQFRKFSTKSAKIPSTTGDLLKVYNQESNALFGPLHKPKKTNTNNVPQSIENNSSTTEMSSEMYWLIEHKPKLKIQKARKPKNEYPPSKQKRATIVPVTSLGDALKNLSTEYTSDRVPDKPHTILSSFPIPFTANGLKSLVKFPLNASEASNQPETEASFESIYPSVGKILQATLSDSARKALINWKLRKIEELGEEEFNRMQTAQLNEGKMFHQSLEDYLSSGTVPEPHSKMYTLWQSVSPALETLRPQLQFAEKMLEHPFLKYRGVVDCVCTVNSETAVIEWKKSEKQKATINLTYDAPLQLCAYLGALTADPQYQLIPTNGYVIVAHTEGQPAQVYHLDKVLLQRYWQLWLKRLQEFWIRTRDGTLPDPI